MVDGILASCYGSYAHDLAHIVMKPMQWYPSIMNWIFGVEFPTYVYTARHLGEWLLPTGQLK